MPNIYKFSTDTTDSQHFYEFEVALWRDILVRRETRFLKMFPEASLNEVYLSSPLDPTIPELQWLKDRFSKLIDAEAKLLSAAQEEADRIGGEDPA